MKKLTAEREAIALRAIEQGRAAYRAYRDAKESTFTESGRKLITPYWDAQNTLMETLGCSATRAVVLVEGKKTLKDFYEADGTPKKVSR